MDRRQHALLLIDLLDYQAIDHVECFDLLKAERSIYAELESW
jgi:hypothetical protein